MFLKNRNISSKIKRSKVTDYAALNMHVQPNVLNWARALNLDVTLALLCVAFCCFLSFSHVVSLVACGT